ncbi:MAG: HD domain-containing protein [Eubacterium sp.]|nr:HD domain-containing protein [Eubacterium sp.]
MRQERLDRQFAFIREIDQEKKIGRQTYISDASRKENDAEHAWHAAVMAVLLSNYANEKIDVLKTVTMLLLHDVVEIDAGDTYAYDEEGKKTQRAREERAADRIYGILPEDQKQELRGLWEEFEAAKTPEAKFARAMDHLQPLLLNDASKGKSWIEHGVELSQVLARNAQTAEGSEELWNYAKENWVKKNVKNGNIQNTEGTKL